MTPSRPEERPRDCDCCAGTEVRTPRSVANLPGQTELAYRVGAYADFLSTMKAELTGLTFPVTPNPLKNLTARAEDDWSIALLDAWAMVADVLTFYQERLANEGYLPTARDYRSIRELARLVGYQPRPGVAADVYLAFTLDKDARTTIRKGQSAKSVPNPGETAQTFETVEDLKARAEWSAMHPLQSRLPTFEDTGQGRKLAERALYLKGLTANLKPNDPLLLVFDKRPGELWRVKEANPDATAGLTTVRMELWHRPPDPRNPTSTWAICLPPLMTTTAAPNWDSSATLPWLSKSQTE